MDIENALEVFKSGVAATTEKATTQQAMLPTVQIRPAGAQAVSVKRERPLVLQNLKYLADIAGEDWYYSWDVRDKNSKREDGKTTIEGPSVKLANDLAREYGNCAGEVWKVDDIGTHWVFHARFIDFETGYEYSRPFRQRKLTESGGTMNADRQQDIVFQIGASKAFRNCVVNALGSFAEYALAHAKNALMTKVEQAPEKFKASTLRRIGELGYPLNRIERAMATVAADWGPREICQVIAQMRAITEGMASFDELYPDPEAPKGPQPDGSGGQTLQNFASQTKTPEATQNAPAATGEALEGKPSNVTTNDPAAAVGDAGPARKARSSKAGAAKPAVPPATGQAVDAGPVAESQQPKAEGPKAQEERVAPAETRDPAPPVKHGQHPDPADETCAHCGATDGTHFEDCPLTAVRPEPTDAKGNPIKANGDGEVVEDDMEIPTFLKRKAVPSEEELMKLARDKFKSMSKFFHQGYVARGRGASKTDVPDMLGEMPTRHWGAGWDARDMEEESDAQKE